MLGAGGWGVNGCFRKGRVRGREGGREGGLRGDVGILGYGEDMGG